MASARRAAGDDVWSAALTSARAPLGAHELLIRASDTHGEVAPTVSTVCGSTPEATGVAAARTTRSPVLRRGGLGLLAVLVVGLLVGLSRREAAAVTGLGTAEGASTPAPTTVYTRPSGTDFTRARVVVITWLQH